MTTQQVAQTILQQLGGKRFTVMTGAKSFGFSTNEQGNPRLSFKIGYNSKKITHVRITLNDLDLYEVEYISWRGANGKVVSRDTNVYAEDLQRLFTEATGLDTHL